ncbi:hypothetical protein [Janibacter massiliensis]|uniref:hypothetical protein n=1 Tax=Janibacter massiliensis TaxID=2058291 RepID=UPI000D0FA47C|nr:hypothetical protein [Janibacter massiliensis]
MGSGTAALLDPGSTGTPPQRWARIAAWGCLLCLLPSMLWRVLMLAGAPLGFAEADEFRSDPALVGYVLGLDAVELVAATLCVGLARPWGERVPRWVPGLRGRRIHRLLPTAAGWLGWAVVTLFVVSLAVQFGGAWLAGTGAWTPADGMNLWQRVVLGVTYGPMALWPALLAVALVGYWRRRAPARADSPTG